MPVSLGAALIRRLAVAGTILRLIELLVDHHFLADKHIELHVTMVLASDVQGIHSDIAITRGPHTDSCRSAAAHDTCNSEHQQEQSVLLVNWVTRC